MPRIKLKPPMKLLGIALPIATVATVFALLSAGGLPQIGGLPDLIAYALELAPRTMYAIAIGGSTALAMRLTGMDIPNDDRAKYLQVAGYNKDVRFVLLIETLSWFGWAVFFAVVYHPWS